VHIKSLHIIIIIIYSACARVHALGHTPTSLLSVDGSCLCLFPRECKSAQVFLECLSSSSLSDLVSPETRNLPVWYCAGGPSVSHNQRWVCSLSYLSSFAVTSALSPQKRSCFNLRLCSSVCLYTTSRKNCRSDFHKNYTTDVFVNKTKLIKCWKSFASASGSRNFLKYSLTLKDMAYFHNVAHIYKKTSQIFL